MSCGPTSTGSASLWRVRCRRTGISVTVCSQYAYGAWLQARPLVGSESFDDCEFEEHDPRADEIVDTSNAADRNGSFGRVA